MAIPATNIVYDGQGPTATGQVLAQQALAGQGARLLPFTASVVLDGSLTSFSLNYIDGTATIPTPQGIILTMCGGTAAATNNVLSAVSHNASTGQDDKITVTIASAGSNLQTYKMAGFIVL